MPQIFQPINQVRLTNVAIVRMNRGGKRFEIACYRNKVVNYRQGLEQDLSEVLQVERVFTNVSKGEFANASDLQKVFGKDKTEEEIIHFILTKGDLQVSDLERTVQYEQIQRDVATWISRHCVHATTQRPFTITQIRQAMKEAEFVVKQQQASSKSIKKQYLDCLKRIQTKQVLPIVRAKMELSLLFENNNNKHHREQEVQQLFKQLNITPKTTDSEDNSSGNTRTLTFLIDPSHYRQIEQLSKSIQGRLEIINQVVTRQGDTTIHQEIRQNQQLQQQQQQQQQEQQQQDASLSETTTTDQKQEIMNASSENNDNKVANQDDEEDDDDEQEVALPTTTTTTTRQKQKRAMKKSKKAKRRERQEQEERQARIQAEQERQQERLAKGTGNHKATTSDTTSTTTTGGKSCNTCGGNFVTMSEYRSHFKSDWHRYNQKLKLQGAAPVSEEEFRLCDDFFDL